MAHKLQARPRNPYTQTFYTLGETSQPVAPARFKAHIAEAGEAANILARNPHHTQDMEVKPQAGFTEPGAYARGLYANRSDGFSLQKDSAQIPSSLTAAKLVHAKDYAR